MGTKTFAVFEGISQECTSGFDDERQIEQLSGRYRGTGTGSYRTVKGRMNNI